jgi:dinuclear metal center YbgI/SA1388 family protein
MVALDVTEGVVAEARRRKADLLVSHHPLLFRPVQSVHPGTAVGRCLRALITADVALLSAHTNLDFAQGGTSFALGEALGIENIEFLRSPYRTQKKIVTFVPASHVDSVADAMAAAGAGKIGNYDQCSFRVAGTGTFRGNALSRPAVGQREVREQVPEVRLEMVAQEWDVDRVVRSMISAHPYEEVAYDVLGSEAAAPAYGMGIIGSLPRSVRPETFLRTVKKALGAGSVRCTPFPAGRVQRIAACGGSGADLLPEALRQRADAFVTADVKYHAFQEARGQIMLVDAGHWETEFPVVRVLASRLRKEIRREGGDVSVGVATTPTNPVISV